MKERFLFLAAMLLTCCFVVFSSCSSDDPTKDEDQSEYYVRYSYQKTGPYQVVRQIMTSNGDNIGTYGPVKKGFRAWMRVDHPKVMCIIEVSKDNGPFAIKASSNGEASYMID